MRWIFIFVLASLSTFAQETKFKPHYTNMTEFGGLFGRVGYGAGFTPQFYENRQSFTLQSFNGIQLKPIWAVGFSTGIDWYKSALIMPLQIGTRLDFAENPKRAVMFALLDGGYGFNWLNADPANYKTKGGFTFNTGLGIKLMLKSQAAITMTLSYKMQNVFVEKPLFWGDIERTESRTYNRMGFRIGMSF